MATVPTSDGKLGEVSLWYSSINVIKTRTTQPLARALAHKSCSLYTAAKLKLATGGIKGNRKCRLIVITTNKDRKRGEGNKTQTQVKTKLQGSKLKLVATF